MKLALLSDIHGNSHALDACLDHALAHGAERLAFLGDLVGYGGDPTGVLDQIMSLAEQGAVVLQGNHDAMALQPPAQVTVLGDATAQWTHDQLQEVHRAFLAQLPVTAQVEDVLLVHASAHEPRRWHYIDDVRSAQVSLDAAVTQPGIRYVFGGHVHQQTLYYRSTGGSLMAFQPTAGVAVPTPRHRQWLATIGSVGQPRDRDPRAMYAMFDTRLAQLTFHRVDYDHQGAAAAIRGAGLPEFFAQRLEDGR